MGKMVATRDLTAREGSSAGWTFENACQVAVLRPHSFSKNRWKAGLEKNITRMGKILYECFKTQHSSLGARVKKNTCVWLHTVPRDFAPCLGQHHPEEFGVLSSIPPFAFSALCLSPSPANEQCGFQGPDNKLHIWSIILLH